MSNDYLSSIYSTREWFESLAWQHRWIEFMTGWWCGEFGHPLDVIDLGCGDGWWCKAFHDAGTPTTTGIELYETAQEFIPNCVQTVIHDLREPLHLYRKADMVLCLEVAEHLNHRDADMLLQNAVLHASNTILFTAAGPGQDGMGHINLQTQDYWRKKFEERGVKFSPMYTGKVRDAFKKIVNEYYAFIHRNIMVFKVV